LRKRKGYTQSDLAERLGLKRGQIGSYEEHRAEPKLESIQKMAYLFGTSLDSLINQDLTKAESAPQVDQEGKTLRILPIVLDPDNREQISIVPVAARAGYTHGYADPKRVTKESNQNRLLLKSDNVLYDPFYLHIEDLIEVWRTLGYMSFDMPDRDKRSHTEINQLSELVIQLKKDVDVLKSQ